MSKSGNYLLLVLLLVSLGLNAYQGVESGIQRVVIGDFRGLTNENAYIGDIVPALLSIGFINSSQFEFISHDQMVKEALKYFSSDKLILSNEFLYEPQVMDNLNIRYLINGSYQIKNKSIYLQIKIADKLYGTESILEDQLISINFSDKELEKLHKKILDEISKLKDKDIIRVELICFRPKTYAIPSLNDSVRRAFALKFEDYPTKRIETHHLPIKNCEYKDEEVPELIRDIDTAIGGNYYVTSEGIVFSPIMFKPNGLKIPLNEVLISQRTEVKRNSLAPLFSSIERDLNALWSATNKELSTIEQSIISLDESSKQAFNYGITLRDTLSRPKVASFLFRKILARYKLDSLAKLNLGITLNKSQKISNAEVIFKEMPNYFDAQLELSRLYYNQNNLKSAKEVLENAIAKSGGNSESFYLLGDICYLQGEDDAALDYLMRSLKYEKKIAEIQTLIGDINYYNLKDTLALNAYRAALKADPDYEDAKSGLADIFSVIAKDFYSQKEYDLALTYYDSALYYDVQPDYIGGKAYSQYNLTKYSEAVKTLVYSVSVDPNDAFTFYDLGYVYFNGSFEESISKSDSAVKYYSKAVEINPTYIEAINNRGVVYLNQSKFELASSDFKKVITINPQYYRAYYNRGLVYYNLKEFDKAISDLSETLHINPNYTKAYYYKGLIYYNLYEDSKAIENFDKVIELDPQDNDSYFYRGILNYTLGNVPQAKVDLDHYLSEDSSYLAFFYRGRTLLDTADYNNAIRDFDNSLELNPNYADTYFYKAYAVSQTSNSNSALEIISKGIEIAETLSLRPDGFENYYANQGWYYYETGSYEKAKQATQKALSLNKDIDFATFNLGLILLHLGDNENALKAYKGGVMIIKDLYASGDVQSDAIQKYGIIDLIEAAKKADDELKIQINNIIKFLEAEKAKLKKDGP